MMWWLFAAVSYLVAGAVCVKVAGPMMWRKAEDAGWSYPDANRESVMAQSALWLLLWPFMLVWTPLVYLLGHSADRSNPERLRIEAREREQQIREQQSRIAELERELGIGR